MTQKDTDRPQGAACSRGEDKEDPRLILALKEYQALLAIGHKPDRAEFLARNAAFAESLAECLDGLEFVHGAVDQLASSPCAAGAIPDPKATGTLPLGDYEILHELGRGGMGVVFEARQLSLDRHVALKVLPFTASLDPRQLQRFKTEAQATAHLHHTNIVPIFAVGCERGIHFYVMQFIEGRTLGAVIRELEQLADPQRQDAPTSSRLAGGTLTTERSARSPAFYRTAAQIGVQVAEALAYAHARGVIHRDIKPTNLLLDGQGNTWITDFGLAQFHSNCALTMTGDVIGTLRYMSPEQALGKRELLDHRTDIYSLGATLYELLTLRPAFPENDRQALVRQIGFDEPCLPRRINRAVPVELEIIVQKAMAKEPDGRYATAQELADDLRRFLEDKPIRARRPNWAQRTRQWGRRHKPVVIGGIVVLLMAVLALTIGSLLLWREQGRTQAALTQALAHQAATEEQRGRAETGELLARRYLYGAQMNLALNALEQENLARALELLESQKPRAGDADLRSFEWYYLWGVSHTGLCATLHGHTSTVRCATFSGDGGTIASGSQDGMIRLWDAATGREQLALKIHAAAVTSLGIHGNLLVSGSADQSVKIWDLKARREVATLLPERGSVDAVAIARDGQTMACATKDGTVTLWDVATRKEQARLAGTWGLVTTVAFDPTGKRRLFAGYGDHKARLWDLEQGKVLATFQGHKGPILGLALKPDGEQLATSGYDWLVKVWDVNTRQARTLDGHSGQVNAVAWSPDGAIVASGGLDGAVRVWDIATFKQQRGLRGHRGPVTSLTFSPDGRMLASTGIDQTVKLWDMTRTAAAATVPVHMSPVTCVALAADGKTGASGSTDGTVKLWDTATRRERFIGKTHGGAIHTLAFAPDSATMASGSADTTVKLWDAHTGEERTTLTGHTRPVLALAFAPDGKTLATTGRDRSVMLWDLATGKQPEVLMRQSAGMCLAFAANGKTLACGGDDGGVLAWDLVTRQAQTFAGPGDGSMVIHSVAFAPDGKALAGALDWRIILWETGGAQKRRILQGHLGSIHALAYSPDGKTLATGSVDATVKLWDPVTAEERLTLKGPPSDIHSLGFSANGRLLAAGRHDGSVTLWHAARESQGFEGSMHQPPEN
jgi:eukaryotic-like serine/threonine-protein kinase